MIINNGVLESIDEEDIVNGNCVIPDSVTEIGEEAFWNCKSLTQIEIPNSVTEIGECAFSGCSSLTQIKIPDSVTEIGGEAFAYCSSLTQIKIPDSVTKIGWEAFWNCKSLTQIKLSNSVTEIGERTFYGCSSLTQIKIPDSVTEIEREAFAGCISLTKIEIPVTEIGEEAFSKCSSLTQIKLSNSVTEIGAEAFRGYSNLTQIEIPDSVTKIEILAFYGCSSLRQIKIPDSVTEIGGEAFADCISLTEIEIPDSVTEIGEYAFSCCRSLTQIKLSNSVTEIEEGAFCGCSSLTEIEIPDSVTEIGERAFSECSSLTQIKIPSSVTFLDPSAFDECENIYIEIPQDASLDFKIMMFESIGYDTENDKKNAKRILFGADFDAIEKLKSKAHFQLDEDYNEQQMDWFYFLMVNSIGLDEIEKMLELPKLTAEEIKEYTLEKDKIFQELYNTKYKIEGDLGVTLNLLKQLQLSTNSKDRAEKNKKEIRMFKAINEKLEEGYEGLLIDLIKEILEEQQIEQEPEFIGKIRKTEEGINKALIKENLKKVETKIEECLNTPNEQYPTPIVQRQINPIKIMVNETIESVFRRTGKIDIRVLRQELENKIEHAGAPYIVQNKEQIVSNIMKEFENEDFLKKVNHSCIEALKDTKRQIGGAWRYKIITALGQLGYRFENLPENFSQEEIEKLKELLGKCINLQTNSISTPKKGIDRKMAYELLAGKDLPKIVTYKQIHDMFGTVYPPFSKKFREFYKKHREEFLENPKYYASFGQIHNNFDYLVNAPQLKNMYEKGELTIEAILGYMETLQYGNQRPGDEEVAKYAKIFNIVTNKEFEHVQEIFDITRRRERTTIPPITVTKAKYRGRMLSPDDVLNLFAGNITTCCQRFGDVGEGAMILGSIEENGGIFVVEELDENGQVTNIIGQSLTIRQKGTSGAYDRLTFDNIEIDNNVKKKLSDEEHAIILELYKQAGEQAIQRDKKFLGKLLKQGKITQEQYDSLVLKEVIAGTGYNDLKELNKLPGAQIAVPDEADFEYKRMGGQRMAPWLDSVGGKSKQGSDGTPVIIASMDKKERETIEERKSMSKSSGVKTNDIPLWYGRVGKVQTIQKEVTDKKIKLVKKIEEIVYRKEQQIMNNEDVDCMEDIEYSYGIKKATIKIGSNNDWYLIYGQNAKGIVISDLAVIGGINSQKTEYESDEIKSNPKLAVAESANELYQLLINAGNEGKRIICNATADTSLINIERMAKKGCIQLRTLEGKKIEYREKDGLVYVESGTKVQTRSWSGSKDIQMLDLEIIPDIEKIMEEKKKATELLIKVQEMQRMQGTEKENGIDELRKQMREGEKEDGR